MKNMKKQLQDILQSTFGLESFREWQEEIITHIVEGNDTLVYMPTGGGKSLTYQLPGIIREWITIIISPLISLMKDQVDTLRELWIRAELINSTLSWAEKSEIMHELRYYDTTDSDAIKFLYIAPERLNSPEFMGVLKSVKISLVAIDEAHCISQWGHDFRPSYMKIKAFVETLSGEQREFPVVGLTATATQKVRKDIVERLGISRYKEFISGFDRKNIILIVREISEKSEKMEKVLEIIQKTPWTGIIYCSSRKHVIELSDFLIVRWVKTWVYKWDLTAEVRESEQNAFMNDEYKVMVATNAFGMWIDKKDIRFVVHYNLPGSIENYYQEVGRAGRDGKMSYGIVLASYGDTKIQEFFIDNTYPEKKQVLDFYDYLYKDYKLWEGKAVRVAKTYYTMASESWVGNDMIVWSIVKILEKYNILRRWLEESDTEQDFRWRWLTLLQEKRQHAHIMIDWKRQVLLKDEAYYKLEQIKRLLFYPSCRKRFILEYFWDTEDLEKLEKNCKLCDYCLESGNISEEDKKKFLSASVYAVVLETVKKYNEKFGVTLLVKLLTWSHDKRISEWHLDKYEHHGVFSDMTLEMVTALFESLLMEDYLFKTEGQYPCVGITEFWGWALYKNIYITNNLADLNAYVMQKVKNTSKKSSSSSSWKKVPKWQTYKETLELFSVGKSLKEISTERWLGLQTIESHVVQLYTQWDISLMKVLDMIDLSQAKALKSLLSKDIVTADIQLKPLKEQLEKQGNTMGYFQIKLALAMIEKWDL